MSDKKDKSVVEKAMDIFTNNYNKQIILYGPPGTSKTYSSTIIAARLLSGRHISTIEEAKEYLESDDAKFKIPKTGEKIERYKIVQFHPSYSYEDFVRGISVKTDATQEISYAIEPKLLEKFNDYALKGKDGNNKFVLIIDEINRAPLASVLGELIYGLEYRENTFSTPYSLDECFPGEEIKKEDKLKIADNLYIIGTMNTADRSIGSIDYAVRRRFAFIKVPSVGEAIAPSWHTDDIGKKAKDLYDFLMKGIEKLDIHQDKEKEKTIEKILGKDELYEDAKIKISFLTEKDKVGIFNGEYLADKEMDVEDIKIGHTYFLGKTEINKADEELNYLKYRIIYQIRPIYIEYIKDGLIERDGLMQFDTLVAYWWHKGEIEDKLNE